MNQKILALTAFTLISLLGSCPSWAQPLRDTIWKGSASVRIPGLNSFRDGARQAYPRVTSGLTMTLPVEAWFLTDKEFVIVLDQRALGADSSRAKLQPLIGSWRGITYGSASKNYTGTYGNGIFRATRQTVKASSWSYPHTATVQGSYGVAGSALTISGGTYTTSVNPSGPNSPEYIGGVPSFTARLTKTSRRPSTEISYAFSDTYGR